MNCKKVKDLLVEYIDGELEQKVREDVSRHIETCRACREFAESLKKVAIEPIAGSERAKAPEWLWHRIKDKIEGESAPLPRFSLERLFPPIKIRRPVFAMATALAVVIAIAVAAGVSIRSRSQMNTYLSEQAEFLSYLSGENGSRTELDAGNLGTAIEDYFL